MKPKELFKWFEICRCCVESDDEQMYEKEEDDDFQIERKRTSHKVLASIESDE